MVDANQNLNGLRDLTMPLSGTICHPWASTCYDKPTKFELSNSTHYKDMNFRQYKISKMGWFG